jgi:hypothetical protein
MKITIVGQGNPIYAHDCIDTIYYEYEPVDVEIIVRKKA